MGGIRYITSNLFPLSLLCCVQILTLAALCAGSEEPQQLPEETTLKGTIVKNVGKYLSKLSERKMARFADLMTEEELRVAFPNDKDVAYGQWRVCFTGAPPENSDYIRKLLGAVLQTMLASFSKHKAVVRSPEAAGLSTGDQSAAPEGENDAAAGSVPCPFDAGKYNPMVVTLDTSVNKDSFFYELTTWKGRAAYGDFLSDIMKDLGVPGLRFVDVQGDRQPATAFPFPLRLFTRTPSYLVVVEVKGSCTVPFTLAKQTALRVALDQLYGPRVNLFLTRVMEVEEDPAEAVTRVSVLLGAYDDVPHNNMKQATREIQKRTGTDSSTALSRALSLFGLDFDSVKIVERTTLSGKPPQTSWDWIVHNTGFTEKPAGDLALDPTRTHQFDITVACVLIGGAGFLVLRKISTMRKATSAPVASTR